ncbi:MAG TPA: hypothetical protein PKO09_01895 [Anaerolineae bacterium]|nr:hypothetical protein [Anaerolineae bacterium]
MSRSAKLLIVLVLVAILLSMASVCLAGFARVTYKPAHWSGLVRKYDAVGEPAGWKWGGGIREAGDGLHWAVNLHGQSLGYQVQTGSCYGCVQ